MSKDAYSKLWPKRNTLDIAFFLWIPTTWFYSG